MPASGPPYVCIEKSPIEELSWCGRSINYSTETYYQLDWVLENRQYWTCPECLAMVNGKAQPCSFRPFPNWGIFEYIGPFIGIGSFWVGMILDREYGYDLYQHCLPIMITGLLVMMASTVSMLRKSRRADRLGQEQFQEKLKESPNYDITR